MEVGDDHVGLELDCPHCSKEVKIERPKEPVAEKAPEVTSPAPEEKPTEDEETLVSFLTTELKQGFIAEVRKMISDEATWLPGRSAAGKLQMAALGSKDSPEVVTPEEGKATLYSIIGAFLKAMADKNVMVTADGRSRFLGEEIPVAAGKVKDRRGPKVDPMTLSHAECIQTLDGLDGTMSGFLEMREEAEKPKGKGTDPISQLMNLEGEIEPRQMINILVPILRDMQKRLKKFEEADADES